MLLTFVFAVFATNLCIWLALTPTILDSNIYAKPFLIYVLVSETELFVCFFLTSIAEIIT